MNNFIIMAEVVTG